MVEGCLTFGYKNAENLGTFYNQHESTDILLLGKVMQYILFWREVRISRGESQQIAWIMDTGNHKIYVDS